jgi:hypothetical protein
LPVTVPVTIMSSPAQTLPRMATLMRRTVLAGPAQSVRNRLTMPRLKGVFTNTSFVFERSRA